MKISARVSAILVSIMTVAVVGVSMSASATDGAVYRGSDQGATSITKDTTVDGAAYLAGDTVTVDGTVKGDLYCAGNTIVITGVVEGDVLCAGSSLVVDGQVAGNARLAGGNVVVRGQITKSVSIMASTALVDTSAKVGGDLLVGAGEATVNGTVGRDVTIGTNRLVVNGTIGRNVLVDTSEMSVAMNAHVGGAFEYTNQSEVVMPNGVVAGTVTYHQMARHQAGAGFMAVAGITYVLLMVVGLVLVALVGALVLPRVTQRIATVSWSWFGISLGVGFLVITALPIIAFMAALTIVGMPVAYIAMLVWLLLMATAPVWVAYFVGSKLFSSSRYVLLRSLVGAVVLAVLMLMPVVNFFAFVAMMLAGAGLPVVALARTMRGSAYTVDGTAVAVPTTAQPEVSNETPKTTKVTKSSKTKGSKKA